jgi:hypothetical protein
MKPNYIRMQASLRWHRNLVGHAPQKLSNMIHNVDWGGECFEENDGRSSSNDDTLCALKEYKEIKRKMVPKHNQKCLFILTQCIRNVPPK